MTRTIVRRFAILLPPLFFVASPPVAARASPAAAPASSSPIAPAAIVRLNAPPDCPNEAYVRHEAHVDVPPQGGRSTHEIEAEILILRGGEGRFHVSIRTRRDAEIGERTLDADTCKQAADAAALIVAMLVDPAPVLTPAMEAPREPPASHDRPPAERSASSEELRDARERKRFHAALVGTVDGGSLPALAGGGSVAVGLLLHHHFGIEAGASHFFGQNVSAARVGKGGTIALTTASARAFLPLWVLRYAFWFAPSLGMEVGSISGTGYGVSNPRAESGLWLALAAGLAARWPPYSLVGIRAGVDLVIPLARKEFRLSETILHTSSAVVGRGSLGLEARF